MKLRNITAASLVFLLALLPGTGEAAAFTLETVMDGARIYGEGEIDFSSPEELAISFAYPREVTLTLRGDAAAMLRESLAGKRKEITAGVSLSLRKKEPHTIRVDFPHATYMILTFEPRKTPAGVQESGLYDAAFREKGRVFPFFLLMTKNRAAMFTTTLLPLGWVELRDGGPGTVTRVLPDFDADILLQRLARALAAGGGRYKERDWEFTLSPFAEE